MKKKLLAIILSSVMTFSLLPATAFANADTGTPYPVVGGNIYLEKDNAIVGADQEITVAHIPPSIGGTPVKKVYEYGFSWCMALKEVTFPETMTTIGEAGFNGCLALESVTIPGSITRLDLNAFFNCRKLKEVKMSKSVKSIGYGAFGFCESLTDVYYGGTEEEWNAINFATYEGETANDCLLNANIHFECDIPKTFTDPDTGVSVDVFEKNAVSVTDFVVEKVDPAQSGADDIKDSAAVYNIYFKSGGTEVQPEGEVTVSIPVPEGMSGRRCKVFHIDEDGNMTDMNAEYKDGYLTFTTDHFSLYAVEMDGDYKTGDVNDDGQVTAKDKAIINRYLAGWDGYDKQIINWDAADIDGDGKVTAKDKAIINRYLAGWTGYDEYFE